MNDKWTQYTLVFIHSHSKISTLKEKPGHEVQETLCRCLYGLCSGVDLGKIYWKLINHQNLSGDTGLHHCTTEDVWNLQENSRMGSWSGRRQRLQRSLWQSFRVPLQWHDNLPKKKKTSLQHYLSGGQWRSALSKSYTTVELGINQF